MLASLVCAQGRDMGFDGKTLIHPSTIAAANDVFSPTSDEVEEALEIVHAFQEAEAKGVVSYLQHSARCGA